MGEMLLEKEKEDKRINIVPQAPRERGRGRRKEKIRQKTVRSISE
jgi:hypothetical protein